jgi:trk system potassium uptake protein TrkH
MRFNLVVFIVGILLLFFSAALIPPVAISLIYEDGEAGHFAMTLAITLGAGALMAASFYRRALQLRDRDGFLVVTLLWATLGILGGLPFVFGLGMSLTDAAFEAVSGFTTTGATVIVGLDKLPPSILFYRQELQWLGGIGIIVAAIALLPVLGVGGMQLFKAETPGPIKGEKLTPRIAQSARTLTIIYVAMTAACALLYRLFGMSWFDAVAHSFSTVATGGFSTHDASIAYFDSPLIEAVAVLFMLLGGINFNVHFMVWRGHNPLLYWRNGEVRAFLLIVAAVTLTATLVLYATGEQPQPLQALRYAVFEVASVMTTTGYGIDDFSLWPLQLPLLVILTSVLGGCAASTAGGIKIIRITVLQRQAAIEIHKLIHPQLVRPLKLDGRVIAPHIVEAVWAFFTIYLVSYAVFVLLLMADGMDQVTAFGAVAACLNNLGPGLGQVAANFVGVSDHAKWLMCFAMLLGRLEIFTVMVLFTRAYWRE